MPRSAPDNDTAPRDKFARYRAAKRRQGLKLLRLWVPDPAAPGFAAEAARQAVLINTAPDVRDIERFIEAATADLTLDPYDWGSDGPPAFLHDTSKDRSGSSS